MKKEVDLDLMNEVRDEVCSKCEHRYWEECLGIDSFVGVIIACEKAKKLYLKKVEDRQ